MFEIKNQTNIRCSSHYLSLLQLERNYKHETMYLNDTSGQDL